MKRKRAVTAVGLITLFASLLLLAVFLIPLISGMADKNDFTAGSETVRVLNTALHLRAEGSPFRYATPHDAVTAIREPGGDGLPGVPGRYVLGWDSVSMLFVLIDDVSGEVVFRDAQTPEPKDKTAVFRFTDTKDKIGRHGFSAYLTGTTVTGTVSATVGVDTGDNTGIESLLIYGTDKENVVLIRTNGGALTVSAPHGEILHYGVADTLSLRAARVYHEYGTAQNVLVYPETQRLIAEDGGTVRVASFVERASPAALSRADNGKIELPEGVCPHAETVTRDETVVCRLCGEILKTAEPEDVPPETSDDPVTEDPVSETPTEDSVSETPTEDPSEPSESEEPAVTSEPTDIPPESEEAPFTVVCTAGDATEAEAGVWDVKANSFAVFRIGMHAGQTLDVALSGWEDAYAADVVSTDGLCDGRAVNDDVYLMVYSVFGEGTVNVAVGDHNASPLGEFTVRVGS